MLKTSQDQNKYVIIIARRGSEAMKEKYILDIDLDFFNSNKDYDENREMLMNLIKNTDIITIAREHSYFNFLRDNIEWTNDIALQKILNLLEVI